ncbi:MULTISPECIES: Hint domain-containing protein [Falsihalocynthiibacter]|uniref:Hint domain-containing protein n=1 Tax=Falsihalocynthiibacter TaxID=2854182 RepID=UPI003001DCEA
MKPKTVRRAQTGNAPQACLVMNLARKIEDTGPTLPSGFATGSIVLTLKGEMLVEHLRAGDRIITRDIGMAQLKAVTTTRSDSAYRIRASVLGHDRPASELLVAEGQRILLRDWRAKAMFGEAEALVPVSRLADGHFIARETATETVFFVLEFETPHILYVDGLEVASAPPIRVNA